MSVHPLRKGERLAISTAGSSNMISNYDGDVQPETKAVPAEHSKALYVTAIVLVALALRPGIVSVGPVLYEVKSTFNLSYWSSSLLTSIPDFLMGLLALPTPWLARRFGRDRVILTALSLLTAAMIWRALAQSASVLMLTTFGVGMGIAVVGTLLSGFVKARFASRAAIIMGIYSTALAIGSAASAVVTAPISQLSGSWRLALGGWAILSAIGLVSWLLIARHEVRLNKSAPSRGADHHPLPWGNPQAWRIAIYFASLNLIFYAMVAWIAGIYTEVGLAPSQAGLLLGSFTAAFTISSAVIGWLSKSIDRRGWLGAGAIFTITGLLMLATAPSFLPVVAVSTTAVGLGIAFPLAMTLPLDNTKTVAATNAWTAFVLTVGYLITSLGPMAVGALRDLTGSFQLSVFLLVAVAACMLIVAPFLKPQPKVA